MTLLLQGEVKNLVLDVIAQRTDRSRLEKIMKKLPDGIKCITPPNMNRWLVTQQGADDGNEWRRR